MKNGPHALLMAQTPLKRLLRLCLLVQICGLAFFVAGTHGAFAPSPKPPTTTDFASFYAAGTLANRDGAPQIYDRAALLAAGRELIAPGITFNPFLNPPIFLLVCAPLARMPYLVAFVLFETVTAAFWLLVTTRIAGGGVLAATALAAIPSVWWAMGWGQNAFLSAGLMGLGTLLLRRRPLLAGAAFGALCFKPHFGILIPLALLAGRQWRAMIGAGVSVGFLAALTGLCFGTSVWTAFFGMAMQAQQLVEDGTIAFKGHVDAAGAARLLGASAGIGWTLQAAVSLLAAGAVAWVWLPSRVPGVRAADGAGGSFCGVRAMWKWWAEAHPTDVAPEARNAALVAGTLCAMPFLLFYDLVMAGVAAAWLARAARRHGWRPGEAFVLALLAGLDLVAYPSAALLHLAIGTGVAPVLLWLAVRRAGQDRDGRGFDGSTSGGVRSDAGCKGTPARFNTFYGCNRIHAPDLAKFKTI